MCFVLIHLAENDYTVCILLWGYIMGEMLSSPFEETAFHKLPSS